MKFVNESIDSPLRNLLLFTQGYGNFVEFFSRCNSVWPKLARNMDFTRLYTEEMCTASVKSDSIRIDFAIWQRMSCELPMRQTVETPRWRFRTNLNFRRFLILIWFFFNSFYNQQKNRMGKFNESFKRIRNAIGDASFLFIMWVCQGKTHSFLIVFFWRK